MTKYVGMDVHAASTAIVVQEEDGNVVSKTIAETTPEQLINEVKGSTERTEVVFEEAQWAAWLYEELRPHVERVAVHAADDQADKTDFKDAKRLAKLLRLDELNEVYHGQKVDTQLKILVKAYHRVANEVRRDKNRLKSEFIRQQLDCAGSAIYGSETREKWIEKLEGDAAKMRAIQCYERLALLEEQKAEMRRELKRAAQTREGYSSVSSLPGFGVVRTADVLAIIGTPWRFPSKQKLWSYIGLSVDHNESAQFTKNDQGDFERKETTQTRGLTDDYNRRLKDTFKGAAETAIKDYEEVQADYRARCRRKQESLAKLDIARKLASQCWTIWKRKEVYDPNKACWDRL